MLQIKYKFRNETLSCYRFETGEGDETDVYLPEKKPSLTPPASTRKKGIAVTIEQTKE